MRTKVSCNRKLDHVITHSPHIFDRVDTPRLKRQESISVLEPLLTGTWFGYFVDENGDDGAVLAGPQRLSIKITLDQTNTISASSGAIITLKGGIVTSNFFLHGELYNIKSNLEHPCGIHLYV